MRPQNPSTWKDDAWLLDILQAARKIAQFTEDTTSEVFVENEILQNAVMRLIIVIGEAASQITEEKRDTFSDIPWRQMVGMRHKLVHHYFKIDPALVWEVVEKDIPHLIERLETAIPLEDT